MKIELTIHREGGTRVTMPVPGAKDVLYHFAPQPDGAHVAEVSDERHIGMFLKIPQYVPYGVEKAAPKPAKPAAATPPASTPPTSEPGTGNDTPPAGDDDDDDDDTIPLDQMLRPELMELYQHLHGEKAHPAIKVETLRTRIAEKQAEIAAAAEGAATGNDTPPAGQAE